MNYVNISNNKNTDYSYTFIQIIKRYLLLTKPKIIILLTITGLTGFCIASIEKGTFSLLDLCFALYIGYASSGGAMAINCYIDRDIDTLMKRTSKRASVDSRAINPPEKILIFGLTLAGSSIIIAYSVFNLLTAIFILYGILSYLIGYSIILKRRTILNTFLGGITSPAPILVGYAAVLGYVPLQGWLLGMLVFLWTPSHTWTLATKYCDDYTRANIPMLPVRVGIQRTAQITFVWGLMVLLYTILLVNWMTTGSLLIFLILSLPHYVFMRSLYKFLRSPNVNTAYTCFKIHNFWLATVFIVSILSML